MDKGAESFLKRAERFIRDHPFAVAVFLVVINFLVRVYIYSRTSLFHFSDYAVYMDAMDRIASGQHQYMLEGNFLFTISYIAHFLKELSGSQNLFFIINCLLGSLTGLVIYFLVIRVSGSFKAGLTVLILLTFYSEYMVFSSVFYTPVLMIFLVSLLMMLLWFYISHKEMSLMLPAATGIIFVFLLTFFFKPELKYLPWFLLLPGVLMFRSNRNFSLKIITLSGLMLISLYVVENSNVITHPADNIISNSFTFFGHTDYGGDGGEGNFIYDSNRIRYEENFTKFCTSAGIVNPTLKDYNNFQKHEIKEFITQHPGKWIKVQFRKLFRTFGVVPESTSFKVLYTGLLKGRKWITAGVIVLPVTIFILMMVIFFPSIRLKELFFSKTTSLITNNSSRTPDGHQPVSVQNLFLLVWIIFFLYYIIATVFYGQYQERYRMPVIVLFIIPAVAVFISMVNLRRDFTSASTLAKGLIIVFILIIWSGQAINTGKHRSRYDQVIEQLHQ